LEGGCVFIKGKAKVDQKGERRVVSGEAMAQDSFMDSELRPRRLSEFIGQVKTRENLSIAISAAKKREEPLDHIILHSPPGLGKTTLACIIAAEMGVNIRVTSGPDLEI